MSSLSCTPDSAEWDRGKLLYHFEPSVLPLEFCDAQSSWKAFTHYLLALCHDLSNYWLQRSSIHDDVLWPSGNLTIWLIYSWFLTDIWLIYDLYMAHIWLSYMYDLYSLPTTTWKKQTGRRWRRRVGTRERWSCHLNSTSSTPSSSSSSLVIILCFSSHIHN